MANRFREIEENTEESILTEEVVNREKPISKRGKGRVAKSITAIFGGGFLDNPEILKFLPYIFFLSFLGLIYIANGYWADNKIRQLNKLTNELKGLRTEHVTIQSELESSTNENYINEKAKKIGLIESRIPPKKILIQENKKEKTDGK